MACAAGQNRDSDTKVFCFFSSEKKAFLQRSPKMRKCGFVLAGSLCMAAAWAAPVLTGANVTIDNFSFGPEQIIVARGTRVTWANQDDIPHTVTDAAEQRDFKSPPLDNGEHFEHVFSKPGTYHYFCSLHPKMQGVIIVK